MSMYDQKQVEQLRKRYPKGTRLCLDFMDEPGTVSYTHLTLPTICSV